MSKVDVYFRRIWVVLALLSLSASVSLPVAAPHGGEEFRLGQPDGSLVPVRVFGDEFYQDVESLDGFTLIRDKDGWICYAELSPDGSEYVATSVRYTGSNRAPVPRKGMRISSASVLRKRDKNRDALGYDELIAPRPPSSPLSFLSKKSDGESPAPAATARSVVGITLLIEFPDQKSTISRAAMDDFCNRKGGVGGTTASGSVYDYFYDVSNGLLEYTNIVTPFVTVDSNKTYYDRGTNYQYIPQLLSHALNKLKASGFDISAVTTETTGSGNNRREVAVALNIFYAGSPTQGWANGIWPHAGTYRPPLGQSAVTIDGISFASYQLSNLGTGSNPPSIGTFVHENGHLLMKWPDLYSYESPAHSNGVGNWCVMNSTNGANPQQPNAYLRDLAGWIDITPITDNTSGVFEMASNSHMAFKYARNAKESYYIEARRRTSASVDSRNAAIPGSGLAVWHIHTDGVNTENKKGFPLIALVQADGLSELEKMVNSGNVGDLFRAKHNASFNKTTVPAAVYHDNVLSNIDISEVSDSGASMSFRVGGGAGGPLTYYLTVANGAGGGYYEAGTNVEISATETNSANGRAFLRWTSASVELGDVYALTTNVTTLATEAAVTAIYPRTFALPGSIEADTFGYAQGITGVINLNGVLSGATGLRVARVVDTSEFAEYAVNVEYDGKYKFSYRLLTSSSSAGKFYIIDVTNNAVLDSVTVPTSARASLQTVEGSEAMLKKGRAVLRFEAAGGNYNIDWIAAELLEATRTPSPAVPVADAGRLSYGIRVLPSGTISFSVPDAGHVSVKIYDMRGRAVATLCDGARGPGVHNIGIPAAAMSQGVYIVKMRSGRYSKSLKAYYRK